MYDKKDKETKFLNKSAKMKINAYMIGGVITVVIFAVVLLSLLPGILPTIVVAVHNLSDALVTVFTTVGMPQAVLDIVGDLDEYFAWAIIASIVVFILALGFGLLTFAKSKYKKGRR